VFWRAYRHGPDTMQMHQPWLVSGHRTIKDRQCIPCRDFQHVCAKASFSNLSSNAGLMKELIRDGSMSSQAHGRGDDKQLEPRSYANCQSFALINHDHHWIVPFNAHGSKLSQLAFICNTLDHRALFNHLKMSSLWLSWHSHDREAIRVVLSFSNLLSGSKTRSFMLKPLLVPIP
jgi:hypothetical protein